MGSFANTLFTIMLGWIQTAASSIWSAFTTENGGSFLQWIGRNWIVIAAILCIIGMVLDLGIYLLRWRPMRVWKSFFKRLHHGQEESEEPEQSDDPPVPDGRLFRNEEDSSPVSNRWPLTAGREQEDFSRWAKKDPQPLPETENTTRSPIITGAGYTVPADSPYRRPAEPAKREMPVEPLTERPQEDKNDLRPEIMTQRKRRRRLMVGDLFADPEEELYSYEAPQQLIDKDKAYHQPVYPRSWKRNEGESE